jgi:diguanylate cyclase (GGDEF)-like protein/PAS domain S-box-containing protein
MLDIVVHSMDQGVLVVNADLTVPILNVRATELIDLPRSFAVNPPTFPEILAYQVEVGAITTAYMQSSINDFILSGMQLTETHTYTRKTATNRWLDVRTTPLPQGGFVRTFTDQTERHAISTAKRQSDSAYRALFENAAVGIYRSGVGGAQLRANPELVALNGYHSEEDMLRNVGDIASEWYVDPDRRKQFTDILSKHGRVTEFESEIFRHLTREQIWISESAWVVRDEDGAIICYEGTVIEITERKKTEGLVHYAAHHDALTGLPNRAQFNQVIDEALTSDEPFFLAYLDLDGFKTVNDTYGHGVGDDLLVAIAGRFQNALRIGDPVFRMGGDEFAIIFSNGDLAKVRATLGRLIDAVEPPFQIGDVSVEINVSVGIAASSSGSHASDILHQADLGLYRSKDVEGSVVSFEGLVMSLNEGNRSSA